ncbi:MAG: D-aminoacyl-tRNA deacylase, partial [Bacteroidota bacterium]
PIFHFMRAIIQRVSFSQVEVEGELIGEIPHGLMVLLGITHSDTEKDIDWIIRKVVNMRIFNDEIGKMNLSVQDIKGGIQVISQFTLFAETQKGNRPSYLRSAPPNISEPLYERFVQKLKLVFDGPVATGKFGAYMQVSLLNDGPVTILLDSHQPNL